MSIPACCHAPNASRIPWRASYRSGTTRLRRLGKQVIVAAHGNSLRALVKHLDGIAEDKIVELNIPTARPLVYELDDNLKPLRNYYLGDQSEIAAAMAAVAAQGKARKT